VPLELVEIGTSLGFGAVDNLLVELEERSYIKAELTYIKDGVRIGAAVGGLLVNYAVASPGSTLDKVTGSLTLSSIPLAMHSVRNLVKKVMKTSSGSGYQLIELTPPSGTVITSPPAPETPVASYRSY